MTLHLQIPYRARYGETLCLLLDEPTGTRLCPLSCRAGDCWYGTIRIENPAHELCYRYEVRRGDEVIRREWGAPHLLRLAATPSPEPEPEPGPNLNPNLNPDSNPEPGRKPAPAPSPETANPGTSQKPSPAATSSASTIDLFDRWHEAPDDRPFRSTMFTEGIFARPDRLSVRSLGTGTPEPSSALPLAADEVVIRAEVPVVRPTQRLVLVGEGPALGDWEPRRGIAMDDAEAPLWCARIPRSRLQPPLAYKFAIIDRTTGATVAWERGDNRRFDEALPAGRTTVIDSLRPRFDLPAWRGAGVAIPVFSLRSERSFGVGEFADLKLLIDWAARTGQSIIQILPVNDTTMSDTWQDSYPYNANSAFALHPQYIRLSNVGRLADPAEEARFEALGRELNALPAIDYERVNRAKIDCLHRLYRQEGARTFATEAYRRFFERNSDWLRPYALFCTLRSLYGTPDFRRWGAMQRYDPAAATRFEQAHRDEIDYHRFVQFHLDRQLRAVRDYAHARGVVLKGDIPIGISRTSVDAWAAPELFHMDASAGAPPDDFSVTGQNWGFPTYDWERMAADGYAWWKRRFRKMAEYFDAYRIDHILGFFRIWEVPVRAVNALLGRFSPALPYTAEEIAAYGFRFDPARHTAPIDRTDDVLFVEDERRPGHYHPRIAAQRTAPFRALDEEQQRCYNRLYDDFFYRRHDDFWRREALRKLPPLIAATGMLVCGEDLGMIPHCVPDVMAGEQILSLEIQRMPKEFGAAFGDPQRYPYLSVCTTSTHDMNPIRAWWEEDRALTGRFYREVLGGRGEAPATCTPEIAERIVAQHLASPAMLTILPWQDWLAIDGQLRRPNPAEERINVPANSRHFWRYRMHMTLETLLAADALNDRIRRLIAENGR